MASLRIIFKGQTTTVVNSVRTESEKWVALSASSATFITLLLDFNLFLLSPAQTCRQSWRKSGLIKKKMIGLYAVAVLQVTQEITRNTVTKRKKIGKLGLVYCVKLTRWNFCWRSGHLPETECRERNPGRHKSQSGDTSHT